MRRWFIASTVAMSPMLCSAQVSAALEKCIVATVSSSDRQGIARWVFVAMAAHPDVNSSQGVRTESTEAAAKTMGTFFTRIMRAECADEVREADHSGGPPVVPSAIQFFTQLGVQEPMKNREVLATLSPFGQFADREGIDRTARMK